MAAWSTSPATKTGFDSEDTDGDGRADSSVIFSDGYNDALDGTGSGLLVNGRDVYYRTFHLWRLQDTDGDGIADVQDSMFDGFGVRIRPRTRHAWADMGSGWPAVLVDR